MCGRAAQTRAAVFAAAASLGVKIGSSLLPPASASVSVSVSVSVSSEAGGENYQETHEQEQGGRFCCDQEQEQVFKTTSITTDSNSNSNSSDNHHHAKYSFAWSDNFNMCPGMEAMIFFKDEKTGEICLDRKIWGIILRGGSPRNPLPPTGMMNQHFQALMFNARSDTLYEKVTFRRLACSGKTCLVALDGFFEWKEPSLRGEKKKQPYFVHRRKTTEGGLEGTEKPYLLMPGLWTSVATGREEDPVLDTFTIITTDVCQSLSWLHTRMPVCIWNEELGKQWLERPCPGVHRKMETEAQQTLDGLLAWHAVTPAMSSTKFRTVDALRPLPKLKTVKSLFASAAATAASAAASAKQSEEQAKATMSSQLSTSPPRVASPFKAHGLKRSLPASCTIGGSSPKKSNKSVQSKSSSKTKAAGAPILPAKETIPFFFTPKKTK